MKRLILIAVLPVGLATAALAADFDPDRRALFVTILEDHDCKMHNFDPAQGILDAFAENEFTRDELRAIGTDLMATGEGERKGDEFVLNTSNCT